MSTENIKIDTSNTWYGHGGPPIVRALEANSFDEAIVYLTNSATLYFNTDDTVEAIRLYERALLLAEEHQDSNKQHQLLACLGFLHNHAQHFSLAQDCFGKALALSDEPIEAEPTILANQAALLLAHEAARFNSRTYIDAIEAATAQIETMLKAGTVQDIDTSHTEQPELSWEATVFDAYRDEQWEQLAHHLLTCGLEFYDYEAGQTHNAGICFVEGLKYARLGDNQAQQLQLAQCATMARMQSLGESNPDAVIPTIEIGVQIARELGDLNEEAKFLGDKMNLYRQAQDENKFALAVQEYAAFIKGHLALDSPFYEDAHIALGNAYCTLEDYDAGILYYKEAIRLAGERNLAEIELEAQIHWSQALASQENLAESENHLKLVLKQARQTGSAQYQAHALALLSNHAYERKAYKDSKRLLSEAKQHLQGEDSYPAVIIADVESALAIIRTRRMIKIGALLVILFAVFLIWWLVF